MSAWKRTTNRLALYDTAGLDDTTRHNLRMMVIAVAIGQVGLAVTGAGTALTGFVKSMGASDFILSLLMAVPFAANALQILSSYLLERTLKRRFILMFAGIIGRAMWLPVALIPFFVPAGAQSLRLWLVVAFVAAVSIGNAFISTGFFSLAADVVPLRLRGRYFSARSRVMMLVSIVTGIITGRILDAYTGQSLLGYSIVFIIVAVFGTGDILCFFKVHFPPMQAPERRQGLPAMIGEVLRDKRFMRLILFWTAWNFSVQISGPFFTVYMLGHLQMSYLQITLLSTITNSVGQMLLVTRWGALMDRFGCKPVAGVCCALGVSLPLLWLFTGPGQFWMVAVVQLIGGMVWSGIDLSSQNMMLGQSGARNRSMYFAMMTFFTQLFGIALSYPIGGWLLDNVFIHMMRARPVHVLGFDWTHYHLLFILTTLLRIISLALLLPGVYAGQDSAVGAMLTQVRAEWAYQRRLRARQRRLYMQQRRFRAQQRRNRPGAGLDL